MCSFFTSSSPVITFSCTCVLSHTRCFQRKFSESPNTKLESSFSFGLNLNFLPSSQKNCLNILSPCFSPSGSTKGPFLLQEHEHTAVGLIINLGLRVSVRVNDAFCELSLDREQSQDPNLRKQPLCSPLNALIHLRAKGTRTYQAGPLRYLVPFVS